LPHLPHATFIHMVFKGQILQNESQYWRRVKRKRTKRILEVAQKEFLWVIRAYLNGIENVDKLILLL
jgi:hypothetical protein